jgi:transcriptional regulator GlxA family with amidase domain
MIIYFEPGGKMPRITFLATDGCLFSGIAGLVDALSIADLWHQGLGAPAPLFETEIISPDGRRVQAHGGIEVQSHGALAEVGSTDFIVIPPHLPVAAKPSIELMRWVADRHRRGTPVGAMCTGVFTLAATGLLDGRMATTNWHFTRLFRRRYPQVNLQPARMLTADDGLICTGAATACFKLALYLIESFGTPDLAAVCAKALLVDPNQDRQTPYAIMDFRRDHGDSAVAQAQAWLETNYAGNVAIDTLAGQVGISPRHFKRRFKNATGETPVGYLQRVRIEAAKKRLETTRESMTTITWKIGYEDSSSFRRLFKKNTGLSPREYRDKFARLGGAPMDVL